LEVFRKMKKLLAVLLSVAMMIAMAVPALAAPSIDINGGNAINSMAISGSADGEGTFNGSIAIVWAQNNNSVRTLTSNIDVDWGTYSRSGNNATQLFTVAQTCEAQNLQFSVVNNNGQTVRSNNFTIPAFHTPGEQETTKEAVCGELGAWELRCKDCDMLLDSDTIAALECIPGEQETTKEAACNEPGAWEIKCTLCGEATSSGVIPALDCIPGEKIDVVLVACGVAGAWKIECTICGDVLSTGTDDALNCVPGEQETTKEAVCNVAGAWEIECTECNAVLESGTIAALVCVEGAQTTTKEATCTDDGAWEIKCTVCGDILESGAIPATGHDMGVWFESKAATCLEEGVSMRECADCDHFETAAIEELGHNYLPTVTVPTCTVGGFTTYDCSRCDDSYVADEVPALGHSFASVVTAPTCTEEGFTTHTCTVCDHIDVDGKIPALGHSYASVITAPTCVDRGFTTFTCSVCDNKYVDDYVNANGHSYVAVVTPMTPYQDGFTTNTCSDCGDSYISDRIDRIDYNWQVVEVVAPTCNERGYTVYRDNYWNVEKDDSFVDALGHNHISVVTAPTCTEEGFTTHTCSRCGDNYTDSYLDANGHTAGARAVTKEATRTEKGAWEISCDACDELLESGTIDELAIVGATTTVRDFIAIRETAKNSRVWALTFRVTVALADEDGKAAGSDIVEYTIMLNGNNANLDGRFVFGADHDLAGMTLTYDIKGNGSNIKAFSIR